jgi:hypothetical protein
MKKENCLAVSRKEKPPNESQYQISLKKNGKKATTNAVNARVFAV